MKILVVGAGFSGATVARILADAGHCVEVIDKRPHIAGNAYDFEDHTGIRQHQYGPHIFHTNNEDVVSFLSRFTEWTAYKHRVKAQLADGTYVPFPVNAETVEKVGAANLVDTLIRPYSEKMWGLPLESIDPSITARVASVRSSNNEFYFPNAKFEGFPTDGYTSLISKMLFHPLILVKTNTKFSYRESLKYDHVFASMPIDEYYDFRFGRLPYRSIRFETVTLPMAQVLPTPTVNFTHRGNSTRITEWKQFPGHGQSAEVTVLTYEIPCCYSDNNDERYYPVKDVNGQNRDLYARYAAIPNSRTTFIGRCGLYVYLDMDQAVSSAMAVAKKFLKDNNAPSNCV